MSSEGKLSDTPACELVAEDAAGIWRHLKQRLTVAASKSLNTRFHVKSDEARWLVAETQVQVFSKSGMSLSLV